MEYAFEGEQLAGGQQHRPSVFTHALIKGLRTGDADRVHWIRCAIVRGMSLRVELGGDVVGVV